MFKQHLKALREGFLTAPMRRILSVARKEIRQLMRDVLTMGFVVGVPAVQLLLFGYAINQDVRDALRILVRIRPCPLFFH